VYRKFELAPKPPSEFELTLCGSLSPDNRWVKMAQIIPWSEFESEYAANFPTERGQGKRRFSLNRVMAKLDNTSGTVIAISFLVMNLATRWRRVFCVFLCLFGNRTPVLGWKIIYRYILGNSTQEKLIFNSV
jgi:Transposase DDE domain